jgi:hypothetical protein
MIRFERDGQVTGSGHALQALREALLAQAARPEGLDVGALPVRWPLTRFHVRAVLRQLAAEGLVVREPDAPGSRYCSYRLASLAARGDRSAPAGATVVPRPAPDAAANGGVSPSPEQVAC